MQNVPLRTAVRASDESISEGAYCSFSIYHLHSWSLKVKKIIGQGTYGTVYRGKFNGEDVAIKEIKILNNVEVKREKEILDDITHEHIIRIIAETSESPRSKIYLILEYMDGDTLYKLVHDKAEKYDFLDVLNWFRQAAKALHYLDTRTPQIIHRDVKPLNMLLDKSRKTLKFCDLGKSREYKTEMTKKAGTGIYMAPEVFDNKNYTTKIDIYSLSISLAEALKRDHPFKHLLIEKLSDLIFIQKILDDKIRPDIKQTVVPYTDNIRDLMTKGWDANPKNRPTAQEFVNRFESEYCKQKHLRSSKNVI
ncbi:hypothetical protein ACLKA7_007227 [Drosophila subpalustris]